MPPDTAGLAISPVGAVAAQRQPRAPFEALEHVVRSRLARAGAAAVFGWHRSETRGRGLGFLRAVLDWQARYRRAGQRVVNHLAAGSGLDGEYAAFLKVNGFRVTLDCSAPPRGGDRRDRFAVDGTPVRDKLDASARLLARLGVPIEAQCIVDGGSARCAGEVYRYLTERLGAQRIQFIAATEPQGSLDADSWAAFLTRAWNQWLVRDMGSVRIDLFEAALSRSIAASTPAAPEGALPAHCRGCCAQLCHSTAAHQRLVRTTGGVAGLARICPGTQRFYAHVAGRS
jgi:uncharacterized protein